MATYTKLPTPERHADGHARTALWFFITVLAAAMLSALVSSLLFALFGRPAGPGRLFPPAFIVSTALLMTGSLALTRALRFVRRERQWPFRCWMVTALVLASLFMGVQTFGLAWMIPDQRTAQAASTGVTAFVLALTSMHAMHVVVATLFLSLVTVRTFADRYDHEYYWGISVCAWFWHALGIVWLAILTVFAIAG